MDTDAVSVAKFSVHDGDGGDEEEDVGKVYSLEGLSEEMIEPLIKDGELLTRVELYIACSSEKLLNLNAFMMSVTMKEGEIKGFASENEDVSVERALEFDLVSRILYSELRELQNFMAGLQTETVHARELIYACKKLEDFSLKEKLLASEDTLKQLQEQVLDIITQSATFKRTLVYFDGEENRNDDKGVDGDFLDDKKLLNATRIQMRIDEQQRDTPLTVEKSLSREMDLEKKLTESTQVEEELKQQLLSYGIELCCTEEEASDVWEKLFEADNVAEVLMGISKELLARLHILQFNLNSSLKREDELKFKFTSASKQLASQENILKRLESGETTLKDFFVAQAESLKSSLSETEEKIIIVSSEAFTLREKVSSLEDQLKCPEFHQLNAKVSSEGSPKEDNDVRYQINEFETVIEDLKEKLSKAENRAECAESKCKLLAETNMELNDEACLLNGNGSTYENVESLERQLQESDIQRQHAGASLEASLEKQSTLNSTIGDMENLIEDLKLKVHEAENRADSSEDKCIILSGLHADLNEKVESLERQLQESDIQLQHAGASHEASLEKQNMLHSTIGDMENLIEDLKLKVSKAESRADSAEDKCIILSETHTDLNEGLNFLRGRTECLEAALNQSEGTKLATAKDIGIRAKILTNLVVQLAIERGRLHKQTSSLAKENKVLVMKLQQKNENPSVCMSQDGNENVRDSMFSERDRTPCTNEGEGQVTDVSTTSYEINKTRENISEIETEMDLVETSEIETVRRVDVGVLNIKHVFMAILVLLISATVYIFQQSNCPF